MLLQFSSNFAQGPFQGYVPDLVPAPQVSLASALVGVMSIVGNVVGLGVMALALIATPKGEPVDFQWPMLALGLFELSTAIVTVVTVDEGRRPRDRGGRSWMAVAVETFGREIFRYPSYLWMVGSRLLILAGIGMILKIADWYMERSLGFDAGTRGTWVFALSGLIVVGVLISTFPAARLSDRIGRKPPIYLACLICAVGMLLLALAPHVLIAASGAFVVGVGGGMFLAVDWALLTDIIPKFAAGKFMGFSNLASGLAGVLALITGGTLVDRIDGAVLGPVGPRAAYALSIGFFAVGALCLRKVDPTRLDE
jgi:MFS family permease